MHHPGYPFEVEWPGQGDRRYNGPRRRMREALSRCAVPTERLFPPYRVAEHLIEHYPELVPGLLRLKFFPIERPDGSEWATAFFIAWCDHRAQVRERLFDEREAIVRETGWYPVVTGRPALHRSRQLVGFVDQALRGSLTQQAIERLPGLGRFCDLSALGSGEGQCFLVRTSTADVLLDAGMSEHDVRWDQLRPGAAKWLLLSHAHRDHAGGLPGVFHRECVVAAGPLTLNLVLHRLAHGHRAPRAVPPAFFTRFAPLWYRRSYRFGDGSSITPVPTYHFPGSMGFLLTFADGETLLYSGDLNVAGSYFTGQLLREAVTGFMLPAATNHIDRVLLDACMVGRRRGERSHGEDQLFERVRTSLEQGRNHLVLAPAQDYGLFVFLYLYDHLVSSKREVETRVFLDPTLMEVLELVEWRLKSRRPGEFDDALVRFLESGVALAESVRVFDAGAHLDENLAWCRRRGIPVVVIADHGTVARSQPALQALADPGIDITRVGRPASDPGAPSPFAGTPIVGLDGGTWMLHSSEEQLRRYLLGGPHRFGHVYLFHNYLDRLRPFIGQLRRDGYAGGIEPLVAQA